MMIPLPLRRPPGPGTCPPAFPGIPAAARLRRLLLAALLPPLLAAAPGPLAAGPPAGAGPVTAEDLPRRISAADFDPGPPAAAAMGRLLFYDGILSGNRNISCGTCHHHDFAGSDGLALGIGQGGAGLGPERREAGGAIPVQARVPRNAPALWNLGHRDIRVLFHDGRLETVPGRPGRFVSPAGDELPEGLGSILAAQALFPVTSEHEMLGRPEQNEVAAALARGGRPAAWAALAARVRAVPAYVEMARRAFPDQVAAPRDLTMVQVVNAIAAFVAGEWQSYDSPFDAWLAGDDRALSPAQGRGMALFYGRANCASCHSGALFTDQEFHAIGLPNFGPGKLLRHGLPVDPGRILATGAPGDAYRFRTPSLRNVALTAPYGHNGAYATLEEIIAHHCHPAQSLRGWQPALARLPAVTAVAGRDFIATRDPAELGVQLANLGIAPLPDITPGDVADIVAFLQALTGRGAGSRPLGRPETVPSGLPVD